MQEGSKTYIALSQGHISYGLNLHPASNSAQYTLAAYCDAPDVDEGQPLVRVYSLEIIWSPSGLRNT